MESKDRGEHKKIQVEIPPGFLTDIKRVRSFGSELAIMGGTIRRFHVAEWLAIPQRPFLIVPLEVPASEWPLTEEQRLIYMELLDVDIPDRMDWGGTFELIKRGFKGFAPKIYRGPRRRQIIKCERNRRRYEKTPEISFVHN